jgi:hypothetical protein
MNDVAEAAPMSTPFESGSTPNPQMKNKIKKETRDAFVSSHPQMLLLFCTQQCKQHVTVYMIPPQQEVQDIVLK